MGIFFRSLVVAFSAILLSSSAYGQFNPKTANWKPDRASLLAKSTVIVVEYSAAGEKTKTHKYKLYDIALGKVLLENYGREYYSSGSRMAIIDEYAVTVYDIKAGTPLQICKVQTNEIAGTSVDNLEIVGFSNKGNLIFKQTGAAEANYFLLNIGSKAARKLGKPEEIYKSTFVQQTGMFDYLREVNQKHWCYSYDPETEQVTKTGEIDKINSNNIYRIQTAPNNKFCIYGASQVYNLSGGNVMYTLPVSNGSMSWNGNSMDYTGQRVSSAFSAKGDSVIVIKKMKETPTADEKVQVEIYSTVNNGSVKSFFIYQKGSLLIDTDIPSGWAVFLGDEKIKVVHLTTRQVVREFSVANAPATPFGTTGMVGTN